MVHAGGPAGEVSKSTGQCQDPGLFEGAAPTRGRWNDADMATHPKNARGICRIGWKNVVKPIHLNATNLPIGDDFRRPIYRNIGDDL